jgi:hypothetical protein
MTFEVQKHIHIGLNLLPDGEQAPQYKFATTDRQELRQVMMTIKRAITGKLRVHTLQRDGVPIVFKNYQYILKIDDQPGWSLAEQKDTLFSFLGQVVYMVDQVHTPDNTDHRAYVRRMAVSDIGEIKMFETMLRRHYIEIIFEDADTV